MSDIVERLREGISDTRQAMASHSLRTRDALLLSDVCDIFKECADTIESLQREREDLTKDKANFCMQYRMDCDEESKELEIEITRLRAENEKQTKLATEWHKTYVEMKRRKDIMEAENDMTAVTATWTVELNCTCPACEEYVDLLDYTDFWDGRHLDVPEHGTERSKGVEVICPECDHEFTVDCEY